MKFRTILADPPWAFNKATHFRKNKKGGPIHMPDSYYPCIPVQDMMAWPVRKISDSNSALLLWTTWAHMEQAIGLMNAWGFDYKTGIPWIKMLQSAAPKRGIGYHCANCSEPLLIGTRGKGIAPGPERLGIMFHPAGGHSSKPDDQYDIAERYPAPYLELFHRPKNGLFPPRDGWTFLGNEVDGLDMQEALERLAVL